jgi:hypothetical protein
MGPLAASVIHIVFGAFLSGQDIAFPGAPEVSWGNLNIGSRGTYLPHAAYTAAEMARNDEAQSRILAVFLIISDRAREQLGLRDQPGQLSIQ